MPNSPASIEELSYEPRTHVFPSPVDWRDIVFYQLMTDRFDDGKDHPPYDPNTTQRGRDREEGGRYQGGSIKGITRRLDYIRNLGCNAIWITPPFKQPEWDEGSYHGYAFQDLLAIDPRIGTLEDLQTLVAEAHKRNMYVILDIVVNHTGDVFEYEGDNPPPYNPEGQYPFKAWRRASGSTGEELTRNDAIWPKELQNPDCFKRRGAIRDMGSAEMDEMVNGDFFSLKELNPDNPIVGDVLVKCFKYWIAQTDIDGFRIDTVKHVEPEFLAKFCNAINEYCERIGKYNFMMFGEVVGDDDLLHKYVGNNGPAQGTNEWFPRLHAVLDFPLYAVLDEVVKGTGSCAHLRERYEHFRQHYRDQGEAAGYYVTFVDNHDQMHRPYRRFMTDVKNPELGVQAIAYLMTNLGMPCIYSGTEQGFDGAGDSDHFIREAMFGGKWGAFDTTGMHFFNEDHPIYKGIARVAKIRASEPALRYGRQYFRDVSGNGTDFGPSQQGFLAFSRVLDTEEVLMVFNFYDEPQELWVTTGQRLTRAGSQLKDLLNGGECFDVVDAEGGFPVVKVKMAPRQVRILKSPKA